MACSQADARGGGRDGKGGVRGPVGGGEALLGGRGMSHLPVDHQDCLCHWSIWRKKHKIFFESYNFVILLKLKYCYALSTSQFYSTVFV